MKYALQKSRELNCHYEAISETCYNTGIGYYNSYGIQGTGLNYAECIHDVSVCGSTAAKMAELFNTHELLPVHFREAVGDFIAIGVG